MAVIVWFLGLQLPMQSVPITTDVVSSNLDRHDITEILLKVALSTIKQTIEYQLSGKSSREDMCRLQTYFL